MLSSNQNNRIAESRLRFGADRPVVPRQITSDTSLQTLQSYLITGWVVPPFHITHGFERPWTYDAPVALPSETTPPVRMLLDDAVKVRLTSSYKRIGIALSGGLDSTVIAALCRENYDRHEIMAFTLDFGPPWSDEVLSASIIAKKLDIPLFIVDASPTSILASIFLATNAMIAPYGDAACTPWYLIGQAAAAAGCDALFSGEGGDQVFGGWANKPMVAELALTSAPVESIYARTFHRFLEELPDLLTPDATTDSLSFDVYGWIRSCLPQDTQATLIQTLRHLNFSIKGGGTILPRFTEMIEAHRIDAHAPFFDTHLVAAAMGMTDSTILDGSVDKAILRQLVAELTCPEIAALPKRGMGVPSTSWAFDKHSLGFKVRSVLDRKNKHRDRRIRQDHIDELLSGIVTAPDAYRKRRLGERIWTLFQWEVFREVHSLSE